MAENFENFLHLSKATECSVQGDFWATVASLSPKCQEFHFILPATQGGRSCYCHPCSTDGKKFILLLVTQLIVTQLIRTEVGFESII